MSRLPLFIVCTLLLLAANRNCTAQLQPLNNQLQPLSGQIAPLNPLRPQPRETTPQSPPFQPAEPTKEVEPLPASTQQPTADAPKEPLEKAIPPATLEVITRWINGRLAEIQASTALTEDEKKPVIERLQNALNWVKLTDEFRTKTAQHRAHAEASPQLIQQARAQLESQIAEVAIEFPADATIAALEQSLRTAEQELEAAKAEVDEQESAIRTGLQNKRKESLGKRRAEIESQLEELRLQREASDPAVDETGVALETRAHIKCLEAELLFLQASRDDIDASADLVPIARDLAVRQQTRLAKIAQAWRDHVAQQRKAESQRQMQEAKRALAQKLAQAHPELKAATERNVLLAESRTQVTERLEATAAQLESLKSEAEKLASDYETVQNKVKAAGMTPAIGLLLRNRNDHMPKRRPHNIAINAASAEMQKVQFELLELETERAELGDKETAIESMLTKIGANSTETEELRPLVRSVIENRCEYLDQLTTDYTAYHDDLSDLELQSRQHVELIDEYSSYIDQRVLWIRSAEPVGINDLHDSVAAIGCFVDFGKWKETGAAAFASLAKFWAIYVAAALLIAFAWFCSLRLRFKLNQFNQPVDPKKFFPTIAAFVAACLISLWRPALLWSAGWLLVNTQGFGSLVVDLGYGMQAVAWVLGAGMFVLELLRKHGMAVRHFGWDADVADSLRGALSWTMLFGLPLVFLVTVFENHDEGEFRESLGRLAFIAGMLLFAIPMHFVMRPSGGVVAGFLNKLSTRWPYKLRQLWYVTAMAAPFSLAGLAALGYSYSAHQLVNCIDETILAGLGMYIAYALISRAFAVRCAKLQASRTETENADGENRKQRKAMLLDARDQIDQLMRWSAVAGLALACWLIWAAIIPAFNAIGDYEVWSTTLTVTETVADADGNIASVEKLVKESVTLSNVLMAVIIFGGAWVAISRLQGVLELTILDRLPLDRGGRHAVVVLARYACAVVAGVFVAQMLHISWSSIQWLIAAMTVGLGFGLQEIFANFVSGLIILFERPIRIGDLITVGDITGRVTRMAIRATIITDYDQRELIVPNKKFITDEVVNWTLTNSVTRFILPVGISYSCSPSKAHEILERLAGEHPLVLAEPKPKAIFVGFGNSTLDLELRAFLANRDDFPLVKSDLNVAIEAAFREAGLEIAFPQQDLHIRTMAPEAASLMFPQAKSTDQQDHKAA